MSKDRLTRADLDRLVDLHDFYVETGTAHGEQLAIAEEVFVIAIGIELDEHNAKVSAEHSKCLVIQGRSEEVLPTLHLPGPTVFYLDAHYCYLDPPIEKSHFPLWDELAFIGRRDNKHDIIIVDDVHTFGKNRPELKFNDGTPEWSEVTEEELLAYNDLHHWKGEVIKDCFVMRRDHA